MNDKFPISPKDIELTGIIMLAILTFLFSWFGGLSSKMETFFIKNYGEEKGHYKILFHRYLAFIMMGLLVPWIQNLVSQGNLSFHYLAIKNFGLALMYIFGLLFLILPMSFVNAKKRRSHKIYPPLRKKKWTKGTHLNNGITWFLYLFAYEFLFRGMLLFTCIEIVGVLPAMAINVALYAGTHTQKGATEALGSVPLGIVLCLITIHTGTIWAAVFIHFFMAWCNDVIHIYYRDKLQYGTF